MAGATGIDGTSERSTYDRRIAQLRDLMGERGFDAIVATDLSTPPQPAYARNLSGLQIPQRIAAVNHAVVVPKSGAPTLVVPPGIRRSFYELARTKSWIENVVCVEYVDDLDWELRTRWGFLASQLGPGIARVLETEGASSGRIGVAGTWAGFEETKALLPKAQFEPTLLRDSNGASLDLLEPLIAANSPWEVTRLEAAYVGADAAARAFMDAAAGGASIREARAAGEMAAVHAGVDEVVLVGSIGIDPWVFWEWTNPTHDRFLHGRLYFIEVARCGWNGFGVQSARSFVLGKPTKKQLAFAATMTRSIEAIYDAIELGMTGGELWEIGLEFARKGGLEPWGQFGHHKGLKIEAGTTTMKLLPNDANAIFEGQSLTIHPCLRDPLTGESGMVADTILIEKDGWRHLSAAPLTYDLV